LSGEQMDQVDRVELLSWLETIERNFDPLLLKGRNRFNEAEGWVGIWLFRSLIGTNYKKMSEDSVNKIIGIFSSRWQTWVTYVGLVGIFGVPIVLNLQPTFWQLVLAYGVIVISLVMSLYANLNRMLSMGDPYFNLNFESP